MPTHRSPKKRMRQDRKRSLRNKAIKSEIKSVTKKIRQASDAKEAAVAFKTCVSLMDRAAKKSVLHKSTVNRTKSRLARVVNKLASGPQ